MGFRLPSLQFMFHLFRCNIFVLSYRGYGESQGEPTEPGILIDAEVHIYTYILLHIVYSYLYCIFFIAYFLLHILFIYLQFYI